MPIGGTTPNPPPNPAPRAPRDSAIAIVHRLRRDGKTAYLAGGCVRDELLGLHPEDYDVATDATPERVAELFTRTRAVGKAFGVMLVTHGGVTIEVATFRAEGPYSDKRRPDAVRFSTPQEDAQRRDFTINALFIDPLDEADRPGGRIIDSVGGLADLEARVIRAVGDPDLRLAEDHLRALRAVRFAARLGFTIDPATSEAITRHATELAGVSRERVGDELRRMLADPRRAEAVALLHGLGLDGPTLGEPSQGASASVEVLAGLPSEADFATCLVAWAIDRARSAIPMPREEADRIATEVGSRWRRSVCLTNDERESFGAIVRTVGTIERDWKALGVAARKRIGASPWFRPAVSLMRERNAEAADRIEAEVRMLAETPGGLAPPPIVTGDHLAAAGFQPGRKFGVWLDRLYDLQLEGALLDEASGIALVRSWDAGEPGEA